MQKIVAVGNRAFVAALAGIGAEPVRCDDGRQFAEQLRRLAIDRDVRLVFIPEPQAQVAPEAVAAFRRRSQAALLALPLTPAGQHPSMQEMRKLVEQATGASLI